MHSPLWVRLLVTSCFVLGICGVLSWASLPRIYRSFRELGGRQERSRSVFASWLDMVYGWLLLLVAVFTLIAYLVGAMSSIGGP